MTKYVEVIQAFEDFTKGKIYEVIDETRFGYLIEDDVKDKFHWTKDLFKEVEAPTKEETITFKFIPETEITYVTVNGVKGILIKEE